MDKKIKAIDVTTPLDSSFAKYAAANPGIEARLADAKAKTGANSLGRAYLNTIGCAYEAKQPEVTPLALR